MEDQELIDRLWRLFEDVAQAPGRTLAESLRRFRETGSLDPPSYCVLATLVGMNLVAIDGQDGAGFYVAKIADDLLGWGDGELRCLSPRAQDVYDVVTFLESYINEDRVALAVSEDWESYRAKAIALLAH